MIIASTSQVDIAAHGQKNITRCHRILQFFQWDPLFVGFAESSPQPPHHVDPVTPNPQPTKVAPCFWDSAARLQPSSRTVAIAWIEYTAPPHRARRLCCVLLLCVLWALRSTPHDEATINKALSRYEAVKISWREWGRHSEPGMNKAASLYKAVMTGATIEVAFFG